VVTLAEGLETVLVAEAAIASARDGATIAVGLERPDAGQPSQVAGPDAPRG
jgi:hypothetical protein